MQNGLKVNRDKSSPVGLIAGSGEFPRLIVREAKKQGLNIITIAHEGETEKEIEGLGAPVFWVRLGQIGKIIEILKQENVKDIMMAGAIKKSSMYRIRPDWKTLQLARRIWKMNDDHLLRGVASFLEKEANVTVRPSTWFLPWLLAEEGLLTKRHPSKEEREDIEYGWNMAKEIGKLDIGQCIVVRKRAVVAVEAMEGTDETILRGGRLAKEKAVVVKIAKPNQDERFDLPAVGIRTIENMIKVKASVLVIEARRTLMFQKDKMIKLANKNKISILARRTISS